MKIAEIAIESSD